MPLSEVRALPASEMIDWERHFLRHPPDDPSRSELLTATLISVVINMMSKKGAKQCSPYDIAPWLVTPEIRKSMEKTKTIQHNAAVLDIVRGD